MDDFIVNCKESEYSGKMSLALYREDLEKVLRLAPTTLVIHRLHARRAHAKEQAKRAEICWLKRSIAKMAARGMTVPLAELRLKKLQKEREAAERELATVGAQLLNILDAWQMSGASFEELCRFCNRDPAQVLKGTGGEEVDISFSKLATIYNLDYKDHRDSGWLEDSIDAPLTHALKAYLLDTMLHTEVGRRASREALKAAFPELWDHVVYPVTDEDGVEHFYDKDGNELWTSEN